MPDTRRVIGGTVWARAEAVSHDAKRIYGAQLSRTWLRGTVSAITSTLRREYSKRATTFVTATYRLGNNDYVKILPLQMLKDVVPEGGIADPGSIEAVALPGELIRANNNNELPGLLVQQPPEQQPPPVEIGGEGGLPAAGGIPDEQRPVVDDKKFNTVD
jgi:hypothetical protein